MISTFGYVIQVVLINFSHAAGHGTIAQVPPQGEAEEAEALAGYFVQVTSQVFHTNNTVTQHVFVARLPGTPAADGFQFAKLLIIGFLTMQFDLELLVKLGIGFLAELFDIFLGQGTA